MTIFYDVSTACFVRRDMNQATVEAIMARYDDDLCHPEGQLELSQVPDTERGGTRLQFAYELHAYVGSGTPSEVDAAIVALVTQIADFSPNNIDCVVEIKTQSDQTDGVYVYYVGPRGAVVDRQRRRLEEEIAKCQEALAALPIITEDRDKVVSNLVYSPAYNDLTAVEDKPEEEETAP